MSFNTNAARLGLATTTENGAAALTTAGAVDFMQSVGERGGALAAMSLHLIGHRGKSYVRQAPPRKVAAPAAAAAGGAAPRRRAKRGGKGKHTGVEKEGTSDANLREFVDGVLEESRSLGGSVPALNAVDLLCMTFDVGDVREGKGERNLFVRMLLLLSRHFARTVIASIALIPVGHTRPTVFWALSGASGAAASVCLLCCRAVVMWCWCFNAGTWWSEGSACGCACGQNTHGPVRFFLATAFDVPTPPSRSGCGCSCLCCFPSVSVPVWVFAASVRTW